MLKNNGLINYVLDFGGKFLFLFDLKKGLTIKMEYLEILPKYVHKNKIKIKKLLFFRSKIAKTSNFLHAKNYLIS